MGKIYLSKHFSIIFYIFVTSSIFYLLVGYTNNYDYNNQVQIKLFNNSFPNEERSSRTNIDQNQAKQLSTDQSVDERPVKSFRLDTKGCQIRELPIFDSETKILFENKTETKWKCRQSIIQIKRFNETWIRLDWTSLLFIPLCYYRQLDRGSDDFHFKYDEFKGPIVNSTVNFPNYEFVHIICYKNSTNNIEKKIKIFKSSDTDLIHNEIIPLIPWVKKSTDSDIPNVLLLAIDSTSYINFKRHFIRTEKFLNENNFFELKGYNKVGTNTLANMIPFLTGYHPEELLGGSDLMETNFDEWPLIWKKFSAKGYITAFVEEMSEYGLFQFLGQGFKNKPTDYATRPFHMEIIKEKYNEFCYKDKTETEHSLDFTFDFIKAMNKRQQKYFAYISICEMTHDWINGGHYMDVPYHQLFTKLFDENLIENTVILFFSDHGFRIGDIRQTHSGLMENRLPFMYIHLPDNTPKEYVGHLEENQKRLTTHFDIHATLTHLIEGQPNHTLQHGQSLFESVINDTRDCNGSSIPDTFCSCFDDIPVINFDVIKPNKTIPKIVEQINQKTNKFRTICTEYQFHSINKIYEKNMMKVNVDNQSVDNKVYLIQMFVNPGMASFETLIEGFDQNTNFKVIDEIMRINRYGDQAHCLGHKIIKNFCFCKDMLRT